MLNTFHVITNTTTHLQLWQLMFSKTEQL